VEPPNEKIGWKEAVEMRDLHYHKNFLFCELRVYNNILLSMSLGTFSFFGGEIILKALFTSDANLNKDIGRIFFLKLENEIWVRSILNGNYDIHLEIQKEGDAPILKLIITIQTEKGLQSRVLIKKI